MAKKQKYLFIHCTATLEGADITATDIVRMHTAPVSLGGRGWKQVGYRRLFRLNGGIDELVHNNKDGYVDPWEVTNGAKGYNGISEHWVYAGGIDKNLKKKDTRTAGQLTAMKREVLAFAKAHPDVIIKGHNEVANKACPCFDVQAWLKDIGL